MTVLNKNIIAFIPARGGSKGIPRKNLRLLGGKPLVIWSIETALACGLRAIVNTDDHEIAEVARTNGAEVMEMTTEEARQRGIHQDDSSMLRVLQSEIPRISPVPDVVMLLQPTAPFRTRLDVLNAMGHFFANIHYYDSLVTVEKVPEKWNPAQVIVNGKMADGRPIAKRATKRQDFPDAFVPTGSIYLFKTSNLRNGFFKKGSIYGDRLQLLETAPTININTLEDFNEAEAWLQKSSQK